MNIFTGLTGCAEMTESFSVECGSLSTNYISLSDTNISIYPNPADNYIDVVGVVGEFSINIYDIGGKKVLSSQSNNTSEVNISRLTKGFYMLELILVSSNQKLIHKMLIE